MNKEIFYSEKKGCLNGDQIVKQEIVKVTDIKIY